jgi:RNA methyltransferase, TrmH family
LVSKNDIKFIKSLHVKKNRHAEGLFIVEGAKGVLEALKSDYAVREVYATPTFINELSPMLLKKHKVIACTENDLVAMGTFETNNAALAVLQFKKEAKISTEGFVLVLDDIADPGNLGTIIRTADWFGVQQIVCSVNTTDFYSPKVINATA